MAITDVKAIKSDTLISDTGHLVVLEVEHEAGPSVSPTSDIYTSIKPVFYVDKALGLACFSLGKENNLNILQHSSRGAAYNTFVIVISMVAIVLANLANLSETYESQSSITDINDLIQVNVPSLLTIIVLICARRQTRIIAALQKLDKCDKMLEKANINVPHKKNHSFLMKFVLYDILVLIAMICIAYISTSLIVKSDCFWCLMFGFNFCCVINDMFLNQFITWGLALRQRFQLLNTRMRDPTPVDADLVQALAAAHSALCDVTQEVNAVFSIQLLMDVAAVFVDISMNVFYVVRALIINSTSGKDSVGIIIAEIFYTLLAIYDITLLCVVCSAVAKEAKSTSFIVHSMAKCNTPPQMKDELKRFSLQLLHQQFSFTACGFFTLDFSLHFTIIATSTMYTIILLQFDKEALSQQTFNNATNDNSCSAFERMAT